MNCFIHSRFIGLMTLCICLAVLFLSFSPLLASSPADSGDEASAEGETHHDVYRPLIYQAINLLIFAVILFVALRKPVKKFLVGRQMQLKNSMELARQQNEDAQASLEQLEKRLKDLPQELAVLRQQMRSEGEEFQKNLLKVTEAEARRIIENAKFVALMEIQKEHSELREKTVRLAVEQAHELIKTKISSKDSEELINSFLTSTN